MSDLDTIRSGDESGEGRESPTYQPWRDLSHHPNNVVLVGVTGAGKTSCGRKLAESLGLGWIDVDAWVEARLKRTIAQIFREEGEGLFRAEESRVIHLLPAVRSHVVSVGGGAVTDEGNWRVLKSLGTLVWLNPPPSAIAERLARDPEALRSRPLLADLADADLSPAERLLRVTDRIRALVGQRAGRYGEAQINYDNQFATPELAAGALREQLIAMGAARQPPKRQGAFAR